jgi:hypothetical protein
MARDQATCAEAFVSAASSSKILTNLPPPKTGKWGLKAGTLGERSPAEAAVAWTSDTKSSARAAAVPIRRAPRLPRTPGVAVRAVAPMCIGEPGIAAFGGSLA